jgi:hypothetical protein
MRYRVIHPLALAATGNAEWIKPRFASPSQDDLVACPLGANVKFRIENAEQRIDVVGAEHAAQLQPGHISIGKNNAHARVSPENWVPISLPPK